MRPDLFLILESGSLIARDFSLGGTDWKIRKAGPESVPPAIGPTDAGWFPSRVPGNIQLGLGAALQLKPLWQPPSHPSPLHVQCHFGPAPSKAISYQKKHQNGL